MNSQNTFSTQFLNVFLECVKIKLQHWFCEVWSWFFPNFRGHLSAVEVNGVYVYEYCLLLAWMDSVLSYLPTIRFVWTFSLTQSNCNFSKTFYICIMIIGSSAWRKLNWIHKLLVNLYTQFKKYQLKFNTSLILINFWLNFSEYFSIWICYFTIIIAKIFKEVLQLFNDFEILYKGL